MGWFKNLFKKKKKVDPVINLPPSEPTPNAPTIPTKWNHKFADISHWEPHFDAKLYKAPILINKCTDGTNMIDSTHNKRQADCKANGIKYGGYHFYECSGDPVRQAVFYVRVHGEFELPPILDFETNSSQSSSDLKKHVNDAYTFMCHVEKLTGKTPIFYSGLSLINELKLDPKWSRFGLWIAAYRNSPPVSFSPWTEFFAWQFSDKTHFDGIGNCDANLYNDKFDFLGLLK